MPDSPAKPRLDYRPVLQGPIRQWVTDHGAEWLLGLGWTICGIGGLVVAVGWLFVKLEPQATPAYAFAWTGLLITTAGIGLVLASLPLGSWRDGILRGLFIASLLLAMLVWAFGLWLPSQQIKPRPVRPMPSFEGEAPPGSEAPEEGPPGAR